MPWNSRARTFDEWKALKYRIKKGAKSTKRNDEGKALFDYDQVTPPRARDTHKSVGEYDYDNEMDQDFYYGSYFNDIGDR